MKKLFNIGEGILNFLNIFFISIIVLIIGCQIFSRTLLNNPFDWPEEVSQFLLIFVVFFGASLIEKEDMHVKVEYIYSKVSKKLAKVLKIISKTFSLLIALMIFRGELELFPKIVDLKSKAARIPYTWIHTIIISGTILWGLYSIYTLMLVYRENNR